MTSKPDLNRRDFLKISATAGAGLVIAIYLGGCRGETPPTPAPPKPTGEGPQPTGQVEATGPVEATLEPNIYLRIDHTGAVTITAFRSEMGQGIRTAIAMIVADEMDVDWSAVNIEQAPADPAYGDQVTGGSVSISKHYNILRRAGATARQMLLAAAAQAWGVAEERCVTKSGTVQDLESDRSLSYGELVAIASQMEAPGRSDLTLKEPADFSLIGTDKGNFDNPQIVDGSAIFGMDVRLPGMLYAAVAMCPVFGGKLASYDSSKAEAVPGVRQVLEISDGLAVVAENTWAAFQGKGALEITWEEGQEADTNSQALVQSLVDGLQGRIDSFDENTVHATYINPYLAHAAMEPMNCTADVRADSCEVWAPTQNAQAAKRQAQNVSRLPDEAVTVHIPLIGGGFGRRLEVDYVRQAVEISKAISAPVKVVWSRADDLQHDFYHPLGVHLVSTKRDDPRLPAASTQQARTRVPTGAWRSVDNFHQALARESFLDELAVELGKDPYELRLELMPKTLHPVLELVAEKSGWGQPLPDGWGRGMACYATFNVTPVAQVAEVSVDESGNVRVHRVVCAVECGTTVNPDGVRAQMEGGIVFGLTAALKAGTTIEGGRAQESNFHDYPLVRFDEMPLIETYIVPGEGSPTGIGEMGVPPTAPAVLNAIYNATGIRIRRIPVRPQDLM